MAAARRSRAFDPAGAPAVEVVHLALPTGLAQPRGLRADGEAGAGHALPGSADRSRLGLTPAGPGAFHLPAVFLGLGAGARRTQYFELMNRINAGRSL